MATHLGVLKLTEQSSHSSESHGHLHRTQRFNACLNLEWGLLRWLLPPNSLRSPHVSSYLRLGWRSLGYAMEGTEGKDGWVLCGVSTTTTFTTWEGGHVGLLGTGCNIAQETVLAKHLDGFSYINPYFPERQWKSREVKNVLESP